MTSDNDRVTVTGSPEHSTPPRTDSPDYARWVCGPMTRSCGHGYHQGYDVWACEGEIIMAHLRAPCLCPCHEQGERHGT